MATVSGDTLCLSPSVMAEANKCAARDATPLENFVAQAVMEKIAALKTQHYFAARGQRADLAAFDRFLATVGTEAPRPDDGLPPGW
jgi:hypothetical protein